MDTRTGEIMTKEEMQNRIDEAPTEAEKKALLNALAELTVEEHAELVTMPPEQRRAWWAGHVFGKDRKKSQTKPTGKALKKFNRKRRIKRKLANQKRRQQP